MKKRILKIVFFFSTAVLLFTILLLITEYLNISICPIKRFTGLSCPGCGFSRATLSLLEFDFYSSIKYNRFAIPILLYIAYVSCCFAKEYIKNGKKEFYPKPEWLNIVFLFVMVIWTIGRNIAGI